MYYDADLYKAPTVTKAKSQPRFSKSKMLDQAWAELAALEKEFGFKFGDGRSRVEHWATEAKIAFGRYEAFRDIIEDLS